MHYTVPVFWKNILLKDYIYSYYGIVVLPSVGAHDRVVPHQSCLWILLAAQKKKHTVGQIAVR